VGDYTFAPWKVCISGFYKALDFVAVGPFLGKPVVLDDTCYFVACQSEREADCAARLLNSRPAREFFSAFVFWDAKRPITIEVLSRLNLQAVADEVGANTPGGLPERDIERAPTGPRHSLFSAGRARPPRR
jgi:hypothetical protein